MIISVHYFMIEKEYFNEISEHLKVTMQGRGT